jgi:hypothetical protein
MPTLLNVEQRQAYERGVYYNYQPF